MVTAVAAAAADVVASGALEETTSTTLSKSHVGRSKVSREHAEAWGKRETDLDWTSASADETSGVEAATLQVTTRQSTSKNDMSRKTCLEAVTSATDEVAAFAEVAAAAAVVAVAEDESPAWAVE